MKAQVSFSIAAGVTALMAAVAVSPQQVVVAQSGAVKDFVAPVVFQAAGPSIASIQGTIDQFRAVLGTNNGNLPGPLADGRREINWDGGGSTATSIVGTPFDGFLITRGARFTTRGTGFVQAPTSGLATTFGNPSYETIFQSFSPVRLFSPIGSKITDAHFFIPGGGEIPATTRAFGAVFSDVDQPDGSGPGGKHGNRHASTLVRYFDASGNEIYSSFIPASPGNASLSFLGIVFSDARIARVRIIAGDVAPGPDDDKRDIVMMDDFIYGEPKL